MRQGRTALYGASLDPLTFGHLWVIERGGMMYDKLVVGVANNPMKKYTFTNVERLDMARESLVHLPNVEVVFIGEEFLVRYARKNGLNGVLRGLRNATDFEYELTMATVNADIAPEIITTMIVCSPQLRHVSSSMVKALVGNEGWQGVAKAYVPSVVHDAMLAKWG